jgi:hypothetical protein
VAPNSVSGRVVYTVRLSSADRLLPAGGTTLKAISAPWGCVLWGRGGGAALSKKGRAH